MVKGDVEGRAVVGGWLLGLFSSLRLQLEALEGLGMWTGRKQRKKWSEGGRGMDGRREGEREESRDFLHPAEAGHQLQGCSLSERERQCKS